MQERTFLPKKSELDQLARYGWSAISSREVPRMKETLKNELIHYIEKMDEYQLHIILGFIKRLFGFDD